MKSSELLAAFALVFVGTIARADAPPFGKVAFVKGDPTVNGQPAKVGGALKMADVIETHEGRLTFLIGKSTVISLNPDSKIKVTEYAAAGAAPEEGTMDLEHGKLRAMVAKSAGQPKKFQFRTRAAVMGVRGTQVVLDSPADPALPIGVVVVEGTGTLTAPGLSSPVTVTNNQSVTLNTSASGGGSSTPVTLPEGAAAKEAASVGISQAGPANLADSGAGPGAATPAAPELPQLPAIPFDPVANGGTSGSQLLRVRLTK